ncbi:MAG TPA: class I SAM-dependent methyltransferase [Candidatus Binatia bacterium]|nr:class I SAM-dependent methyltransferase [Candidatus Binatia bacterium]
MGSRLRAAIYDAVIVGMTAHWYEAVLARLPSRCRLLDIGVGTGSALLSHATLIEWKRLRIVGIDIDGAYIERCRASVQRKNLAHLVEARLESVYDHRGGPYDAAYFSGSFMLLPDPTAALRRVCSLLERGALIFFTQTFEHRRSPGIERIKPLLRAISTIDFGRVSYEDEFRGALAGAGVEVEEQAFLHRGRKRSSMLIVARAPR